MIPELFPQAKMDTEQCVHSPICCFHLHQRLAVYFYCLLLALGKVCAAPAPQICSPFDYSCKLDFYCKESIAQCVPCTALSQNDCQPPTPNWIPCFDNHDTACSACDDPDQFKDEADGQCHYCDHCDPGEEASPCGPFKDRVCSLKNSSTTDPAPTSNSTTPNSSMMQWPTTPMQQSYIVTNTTTTWNYSNSSLQTSFHSSEIKTPPPTPNRTTYVGGIIGGVAGVVLLFAVLIIFHRHTKCTGSIDFPPPSAEMQNMKNAPQGHVPSTGQAGSLPSNSTQNELQESAL